MSTPPTLSGVRHDLAETLEAVFGNDLTVHPAVPETIYPPCLVIQQADPLLVASSTEDTFDVDEWDIALWVFAFVDLGSSNAAAADRLDALVLDVPAAAAGDGWGLTEVQGPGPYSAADWHAHGIRFTLTRPIVLT